MREWFFDRPFSAAAADRFADAVSEWLRSEHLRWLVENVPGRRSPIGTPEPLCWPDALTRPSVSPSGRAGLSRVVELFAEICDWSLPGTVWDFRERGGERRRGEERPPQPNVPAAAVAERAAALGLRSEGRLRTEPHTMVVLGGRRRAPLNRARAAARAIRGCPPASVRVIMASTHRPLDRGERESPEVRWYATAARTEVDLMRAAARHAFGADWASPALPHGSPVAELCLVEAPAADDRGRASTYDTLRALADDLAANGSVALATSPTCRPFQHLEAVRALGLPAGISCELLAHPPAWASRPGSRIAQPHVYLQEIRSTVQAASRLARAFAAAEAGPTPALDAAVL